MVQVIWKEIRRRLVRPSVYLPFWPGLFALGVYVVLSATDNSSTGAGMWLPFVIVPALAGALWLLAGASWILQGKPQSAELYCGKCGYDLRRLNDPRCPECGSSESATTEQPPLIRFMLQLPGVVLLMAAVLVLGVAMFYWALIAAGTFDI